MRLFLLIGGALSGLALAYGPTGLYGVAIGAFVGFVIGEIASARAKVADLETQLAALRKSIAARAEAPARTPIAVSRGDTAGDTTFDSAPLSPRAAPPQAAAASPGEPRTSAAADHGLDPLQPTVFDPAFSSPRAAPPQAAAASPGEPRTSAAAAAAAKSATVGATTSSGWKPAPRREAQPPEELAIFKLIREYFTGGNTLVRVGVVILFIGVAFLLRYVAEHTHVPIELRLSGVAAGAVILLALGWRLRKKRQGYALALQGGAIGILYLTVFASLRLFHVLPAGPAFAVLVLLAAFSAALAILQDSMAFALLAIGCGFLAPVLASSGEGNHVVLFSYYGVLNLGILAIAWFKAWRPLNVVGFLFTFVIGTAWGVLKYRPTLFASTEPFLIAFFLLYVGIAILFSLRQRPILRGYVDGTIVFGVPAVAFGLQAAMVHDWPFATAYSAVAVSALYLALAWLLHRGQRDTQRLLVEAFMALGVLFLTLAVPLALDGRWSAAMWSLEGAALIWVGARQNRLLPRAFGTLLQFASGVIFLFDLGAPYSDIPILNSACLGGILIAFASLFAARIFQKAREDLRDYELAFIPVLFFWALAWWLFSGIMEIDRHLPSRYETASILVFLTGTALLSSELHRRLAIGAARLPPLALLPLMVVFGILAVRDLAHPSIDGGWAAWLIAFAGFYFLCKRHESTDSAWAPRPLHTVSALLLIGWLSWEFAWQVDHAVKGGGSWPAIAWALVPAVALYLLPKLAKRVSWPLAAHEETYVAIVGTTLGIYLMLWSLFTNVTMSGNPYPLPYAPVLNPLDLTEAFLLLVLVRHGLHLHKVRYDVLSDVKTQQLVWFLAALTFVWLNAVLLRTVHHWAGIPYAFEPLFGSTLVQTALTIFWTVLALATMLFATRKSVRIVWIAGAVLMAVVIGKLFLIDLSRIGTVERIVSFVGVGLLMLVVGYFSPLPPAQKEATT